MGGWGVDGGDVNSSVALTLHRSPCMPTRVLSPAVPAVVCFFFESVTEINFAIKKETLNHTK